MGEWRTILIVPTILVTGERGEVEEIDAKASLEARSWDLTSKALVRA